MSERPTTELTAEARVAAQAIREEVDEQGRHYDFMSNQAAEAAIPILEALAAELLAVTEALDAFFAEPFDYGRPCWDSFCGGGRHTTLCRRVNALHDARPARAAAHGDTPEPRKGGWCDVHGGYTGERCGGFQYDGRECGAAEATEETTRPCECDAPRCEREGCQDKPTTAAGAAAGNPVKDKP